MAAMLLEYGHQAQYTLSAERIYSASWPHFFEKAAWTYVKPSQWSCDGHKAYQDIFDHFIGPNNVDNLSTAAKLTLSKTTYERQKKQYNFEKYVNTHVHQNSVLEGVVQYGYSGIDERLRVRHLINGINTTQFDACKKHIQYSKTLRNNFQTCFTLNKDLIKQSENKGTTTLTISQLSHVPATKRQCGGDFEDCYYTKADYDTLNPEQKKYIAPKRMKRGYQPVSKSSTNLSGKYDITKLTQTIAALSKKLDALPRT